VRSFVTREHAATAYTGDRLLGDMRLPAMDTCTSVDKPSLHAVYCLQAL